MTETTETTEYDLARILPKISHLVERQAVAKWLEQYNDISERREAALAPIEVEFREARKALRLKHLAEEAAMYAPFEQKITEARAPFDAEFEAIPDIPESDEYHMDEDGTACQCCQITGLPMRADDDEIQWGDGYAMTAAIEAALAK